MKILRNRPLGIGSKIVETASGSWHIQIMVEKKSEIKTSPTEKNPAAVALGRLGGRSTAKRGPEYYRKIAAKRKHFRGGRPSKRS